METEPIKPSLAYRIDNKGRLIYGGEEEKILFPCAQITDPDLIIGVLDNNNLKGRRFMLDGIDRHPIIFRSRTGIESVMTIPGKSAFLILDIGCSYADALCEAVPTIMKRNSNRRDHLHLTTVGWIEEAGWQAWWAPVQDTENMLHVRLVPDSMRLCGKKPKIEEADALCNAFLRVC